MDVSDPGAGGGGSEGTGGRQLLKKIESTSTALDILTSSSKVGY
jgi:hypothetical protein